MQTTLAVRAAGAIAARAPAERPQWGGALRRMALLPSAAAASPGLALASVMPAYGCLGQRLFWLRCFGCMLAPDVLSLDIPEDCELRMQSVLDADSYFVSDDESVSVHHFARRIIADYMPPVSPGIR